MNINPNSAAQSPYPNLASRNARAEEAIQANHEQGQSLRTTSQPSDKPVSSTDTLKGYRGSSDQKCLFQGVIGMTEDQNYARENPWGGPEVIKEKECCWTCRGFELSSLRLLAETGVNIIKSELQNFKNALAKTYPELSTKLFNFTLDACGQISIIDSDELTPLEQAILTQSLRDHKRLNAALQAHAETLIKYAGYKAPEPGQDPLSMENLGTRVNYAALLAHPTGALDLFGNPWVPNEPIYERRSIDIKT
ncbi:hypothetical protein [Pseudomonas sp. CFII64]|uniref:hypothetical protein n=1 Tax=Pseudomonas sp. CFII64 TaxID=911242 RepID=UPI0012EC3622|nr:hypothetical protein [Pseudomonas sp. CFII64]